MPLALTGKVGFADIDNVRFAADDGNALASELLAAAAREKAHALQHGAYLLALSGGQEDGAFGAGLLVGWSEAGSRPTFKMVTGTSTGAMAAPFAFLGGDYDPILARIYTTTTADDVGSKRFLLAAINGDAMMDSAPLYKMISRYLDVAVLNAIAREYDKGRLLLISTTNLDTGKLVVWNIGAIARSNGANKLELVRKIILASAAVPGVFPPVMLDVTAGRQRHQEMHVDGGTVSQVFLYPANLMLTKRLAIPASTPATAFIIRNGKATPGPENVERKTLSIAGRAIETMINSNAVGDLYKIYAMTQRDNVQFKLALIGDDFTKPYVHAFDRSYMRSLFAYGRSKGRSSQAWLGAPPGFLR